jgi:ketosteroid isomerase-like protein
LREDLAVKDRSFRCDRTQFEREREHMKSVEERLQALEDERDILRTMHQYGHALDYGDVEKFMDCWFEDAVRESVSKSRREFAGHVKKGHAALREFIESHTTGEIYKHIVVDPLIWVDGDTATAESYFFMFNEHEDGPYVRAMGRYRDKLARDADGRWRFKERISELEDWHRRESTVPSIGGNA